MPDGFGIEPQEYPPDYLDRLLCEKDAAAFLGYTIRALQNWRLRGGGPQYVKISARSIRYRRRDLLGWVEARLQTSTSELGTN
jgi:predicted DNA-binding transcriptional regulator AlpA